MELIQISYYDKIRNGYSGRPPEYEKIVFFLREEDGKLYQSSFSAYNPWVTKGKHLGNGIFEIQSNGYKLKLDCDFAKLPVYEESPEENVYWVETVGGQVVTDHLHVSTTITIQKYSYSDASTWKKSGYFYFDFEQEMIDKFLARKISNQNHR